MKPVSIDHIAIADADGVRLIRMNRLDKKNALNTAMYETMTVALNAANDDERLRCIVIAGVPGAFCAGNDLADFQRMAERASGLDAAIISFLHALAACEKPLVAAVDGVAVGIGATLLLHCDYAVAGSTARFITPFAQLGLLPEAASTLLGPRLMGHRRAFELLVMGRPLDAQGAREAGLVNAVAPTGEAEAAAMKAAREIAKLPPESVAAARRLMRGDGAEIRNRINEEARIFHALLQSRAAKEALAAFFSRKK